MSKAHEISWWGGLDLHTFGVWISLDKVFDLPNFEEARILFMKTLVQAPTQEHVDFVHSLSSNQDKYLALTLFTVFQHEWRHWYDFTSTPFGMFRLAQLAAFYARMARAYNELSHLPHLYTPLTRWFHKSHIVQRLHPDIGTLPPLTHQMLSQTLPILASSNRELYFRSTIHGISISTSQILESLAMLQQEKAIAETFGMDAVYLVRTTIKHMDSGPSYYAPIDLLNQLGYTRPTLQTRILETTLFSNYGVFGLNSPRFPSEILKELLEELDGTQEFHACMEKLDQYKIITFSPKEAFELSYAAITNMLDKMTASAVFYPQNSFTHRVLNVLGKALSSAFLQGGIRRYGKEILKEQTQEVAIPPPDPYTFYPVLMVEGYPGLITSDRFAFPITTLAGTYFDSRTALDHFIDSMKLDGFNMPIDQKGQTTYKMHAVWSPTMDNPEQLPPYFQLTYIFQELMYLKGIIFGKQTISPFTYFFTAEAYAKELGQKLSY